MLSRRQVFVVAGLGVAGLGVADAVTKFLLVREILHNPADRYLSHVRVAGYRRTYTAILGDHWGRSYWVGPPAATLKQAITAPELRWSEKSFPPMEAHGGQVFVALGTGYGDGYEFEMHVERFDVGAARQDGFLLVAGVYDLGAQEVEGVLAGRLDLVMVAVV